MLISRTSHHGGFNYHPVSAFGRRRVRMCENTCSEPPVRPDYLQQPQRLALGRLQNAQVWSLCAYGSRGARWQSSMLCHPSSSAPNQSYTSSNQQLTKQVAVRSAANQHGSAASTSQAGRYRGQAADHRCLGQRGV